ncbi:MAG: PilZ domain-containing protein [Thermodesulfobacteriota bacterium]|nr:PilZ domain-containing protein [Thermodesulfobacteriota bacterium]
MEIFKFFKKGKIERITKRVPLELIFRFTHDNHEHVGVLKDISSGGMGFSTAGEFREGTEIEFEFYLFSKNNDLNPETIHIKEKGDIKWVNFNRSLKLVDYDVGCQFLNPELISTVQLLKIADSKV